MKKSTLFATLLAAAMAMPAFAQNEPVKINGSLINWYYWGKDYTGASSGEGWHQQSVGGGAWIDENGIGHSTGESNIGLFSFTLNPGSSSRPLLPQFLIRNHILYSNCGGVYTGGNEYYSFFGHEVDASSNIDSEYGSEEYEIIVRKWTWDGTDQETGLYTNVKYEQVGKMYNQATDFAYDPENDIVYGVFSTGGAYKLGKLDMNTLKITWISREAMSMLGELRTLACNSKGELYGTDKSGNLYHVDKTDGKLEYIGNMGFKSQTMMMSATFDYRTDKLYWLGFMNDGKNSASTDGTNTTATVEQGGRDTGLYEIDVETGEATLIGKTDFKDVTIEYDEEGYPVGATTNQYGKMQLTGIYVEGSIVKYEYDLRVGIDSYTQQLSEGDNGEAKVTVKNMGTATVRGRNFSVSLYVGGQLVGTIDDSGEDVYTDNLGAGETQTFTFTYTAPKKPGDCTIKAVVTYEADEHQSNNTAQATFNVLANRVQQELTLTKKAESDNGLMMSWNAIDGQVTDGAEDYAAFSYDKLKDWTMVDGDGAYTQKPSNYNSSVEYPNWNTPKAFIVMNPLKAGLGPDYTVGGEKFLPNSGEQYFAALYGANSEGDELDNDDYMVSPALSGEAQTISFWAKGYRGYESEDNPEYVTTMSFNETMEVLYTTDEDNLDPTTYEVAVEEFTVNDKQWTKYEANLPAGAKHFALHRTSKAREYAETELGAAEVPGTGSFILMIDDISFRIKGASSYNVYCNGALLANTTELTYIAERLKSGSTFQVKAVDESGNEIAVSNVIVFNAEDVDHNGKVNAADITAIISAIGRGETTGSADVNGDGRIDTADIICVSNKMKK